MRRVNESRKFYLMISTHARIAVVDTTQSMEVMCFSSRMELVKVMLENARIAPKPEHYASPSHEAAVRDIRAHCDVVLAAIAKEQAEDKKADNLREFVKGKTVLDRTDLSREEWLGHVYDGLCHYAGKPANDAEEKNLRELAATMAETYYDEDHVSPADAVWDEVCASA